MGLSDEQERRYKVTFLGPVQNDLPTVSKLAGGLKERFKLEDEAVTRMMKMAPVVIKKRATVSEAEKYKEILEAIGAKVQIEPVEEAPQEPQQTEQVPPQPVAAGAEGQQTAEGPPPLDRTPQVVPVKAKAPPPESSEPAAPTGMEPQQTEQVPPQPVAAGAEEQQTEAGPQPLDRPPQVIAVKAKTPPTESSEPAAPKGTEPQMVQCPQCGYVQEQTDECVKCGVIISKVLKYQDTVKPPGVEAPAPGTAGSSPEGPQAQQFIGTPIDEPEGSTPWEDMASLGLVTAFFRTMKEVLFSPTEFFRKMPVSKGLPPPLFYGVILGFVGGLIAILLQFSLFGSMGSFPAGEGMEGMGGGIHPFQTAFTIIYAIFLPFLIAIGLFILSGIFHLCLLIVGAGKRGFEATFRVVAYTSSTQVFAIVPFVGAFIVMIYNLVLWTIGFRETHRTTTGRAFIAVLLPMVVLVVFIVLMVFAIVIPLVLSQGQMMMPQQPPSGF
jgi:hypothetical protein